MRSQLLGAILVMQLGQGAAAEPLLVPRFVRKAYQNHCRSLDGKPGSAYWQNKAVHQMKIRVEPPNRQVSASEHITYFNNSPDSLSTIVFRLYLNAHRPEAIREQLKPREFLTSGISIDDFQIDGAPALWDDPGNPNASSNVPGSTIHVISLAKPMPPHSSMKFSLRWHYDIAEASGWKEGRIDNSTFYLAYFFPRVSVYNDTSGWDTLPFSLGREFSNDFADFTYEVEVPKNFVCWGTGDLLNAGEVLQASYAERLEQSFLSDRVINIARPEELKAGQVTAQTDTVNWKWKADNVPDVAIAVSNHYLWDAGSLVVDPATGRRASVQSAYSDKALDFKSMVEFAKSALLFATTKFPGVPYPYSKTTIIEGGADEEYPMMVNDASVLQSQYLPGYGFTGFVAAHELLHTWFPFYMGINEKRYPFMDEGWTTAFEYLYATETYGAKAADNLFKQMRTSYWAIEMSGSDTPIITPHDTILAGGVGHAANGYGKAALGYLALKDLMGEAAFKKALHAFMERWNGKHPLPWDMFNTINDVSGKNYNWFFSNWFYGPYYLDIGVKSLRRRDGGYDLEVSNSGGMAMPFDVVMEYKDGSRAVEHQTPGVWERNLTVAKVQLNTEKELKSLSLEGGIWVDFAPKDNAWASP